MLGIERAVDRPHLVAAVGILMVVLGLFSAATIPIELTPPVRVPVVVVAVPYR